VKEAYDGAVERVETFKEISDFAMRRAHGETSIAENAEMGKRAAIAAGDQLLNGSPKELFKPAAETTWKTGNDAFEKFSGALTKFTPNASENDEELKRMLDIEEFGHSVVETYCGQVRLCAKAVSGVQKVQRLAVALDSTANVITGTLTDVAEAARTGVEAVAQNVQNAAADTWAYLYKKVSQ
jgi:hypothetical protein